MPRSFAINTVTDRVNLDAGRRGSTSVTVTNSTGKPLRAWPELKELGSTKKEWLALEGGGEKSFSPNEAQTFKVTVNVAQEAAAGRYEFKLNMISGTKGTEEESTEGPVVGFEVAQPPPPKPPSKAWLFIVLGVIVVGGIVAVIVLLLPSKVTVPDLRGKSLSEASNTLSGLRLTNTVEFQHTTTNSVGTVFAQNPKAKERVSAGKAITLYVESGTPPPPKTPVPDFVTRNLTLEEAIRAANAAKVILNLKGHKLNPHPKLIDRIVDQYPNPGTTIPQGDEVSIWVGTTNQVRTFVVDPGVRALLLENQKTVRRISPLGTNR